MFRTFLIGLLVVFGGYAAWLQFGDPYGAPGKYLTTEPAQRFSLAPPKTLGDYKLFPIAWYQLDARVVAVKRYDEELSPIDLGVTWGKMAQDEYVRKVRFSHSDRYLHFSGKSGLDRREFNRCVGNVHIIPANDEIKRIVLSANVGDYVSLQGSLVQAFGGGGGWSSSLSRDDSGDGACEVLYVTKATFFQPGSSQPAPRNRVAQVNSPRIEIPVGNTSRVMKERESIPRRPPPEFPKRFTLTQPLELPIDEGSVEMPAGTVIEILEESDGRVKVRYAKVEFWVSRDLLYGEQRAI
ncbi:MAG: hypothetical protein AAGJ81_15435 [Verrucomicrobiota bacterium]